MNRLRDSIERAVFMEESILALEIVILIVLGKDTVEWMRLPLTGLKVTHEGLKELPRVIRSPIGEIPDVLPKSFNRHHAKVP